MTVGAKDDGLIILKIVHVKEDKTFCDGKNLYCSVSLLDGTPSSRKAPEGLISPFSRIVRLNFVKQSNQCIMNIDPIMTVNTQTAQCFW